MDCLLFPEAIDRVIIDHAGGLHEGIHGGGADEVESGLFQSLRQRVRFGRPGGEISHRFEVVDDRPAADEAPQPAHGIFDCQPGPGVLTDGENFPPMPDDAGIEDEIFEFGIGHGGDFFRLEIVEHLAVAFTFLQDRPP